MEGIKASDYNSTCNNNKLRMNNEKSEPSTSDTIFNTNIFTETWWVEKTKDCTRRPLGIENLVTKCLQKDIYN